MQKKLSSKGFQKMRCIQWTSYCLSCVYTSKMKTHSNENCFVFYNLYIYLKYLSLNIEKIKRGWKILRRIFLSNVLKLFTSAIDMVQNSAPYIITEVVRVLYSVSLVRLERAFELNCLLSPYAHLLARVSLRWMLTLIPR